MHGLKSGGERRTGMLSARPHSGSSPPENPFFSCPRMNMSGLEIIDLCSDEEMEVVEPCSAKLEVPFSSSPEKFKNHITNNIKSPVQGYQKVKGQHIENALFTTPEVNNQQNSLVHESYCHDSEASTPICRKFWQAGDYKIKEVPKESIRDGRNHLRVHPKFLHSNATSHKWAFGAIAELLDNAVDEIQNGATYTILDKIYVPRNGPALLIQDDGGGMDPKCLRSCMSFGFSEKKADSYIGQYGNGFKTSTMRLGADVIVFSRCMDKRTQTVGLLSYTFLRQTACDDIIVPMVDYEFDHLDGEPHKCFLHKEQHFYSNLSAILKWSPFGSEADLLKQFDEIGQHGTRIIVFNLWFNNDGVLELDFDSDEFDIFVGNAPQMVGKPNSSRMLTQRHIANQLHYSLRAYISILYLHVPQHFRILLRGRLVQPRSLVNDLRFVECIKYTPNVDGNKEDVITTIGFLEGSPNLNIHGFNVYHRNRLILNMERTDSCDRSLCCCLEEPFWRVMSTTGSKGRGVSGVLEANFIKPTHDKQDFEKSTLYFRLESRLKEMTLEYWKYHCHLVGYPNKTVQPNGTVSSNSLLDSSNSEPVKTMGQDRLSHFSTSSNNPVAVCSRASQIRPAAPDSLGCRDVITLSQAPIVSTPGQQLRSENVILCKEVSDKRRREDIVTDEPLKRQASERRFSASAESNSMVQNCSISLQQDRQEDILIMIQKNKSLHAECIECENKEKELITKVERLKVELEVAQQLYTKLSIQFESLDGVKIEKS